MKRSSLWAVLASVTVFGSFESPARAQAATSQSAPTTPTISPELLAIPSPARLRAWHDLVASEPHIAGTPGDQRQIERLVKAFTELGLETTRHDFYPYLPRLIGSALEIVEPDRKTLVLKENVLAEDPFTANPELQPGWNAYSGTGDVIGEVVYANYGTKADFEKLKSLGVDCTGKVVIARYGGNFRGYKAKFAQAAGAAALLIYTDPGDAGYARGLMYPEGGFANEFCIERGSLLTLDYNGDPLTPGIDATKDAKRLDPATVALPKIPVQPINWSGAVEIMKRMTGPAVPAGWQGGLPLPYRTQGDSTLKVRVKVEQERAVRATANIIGTLKGAKFPDELVLVGCHHDAWNCGAADPTAGLISLLETARAFCERAAKGERPARTLVFCAWGAEEMGIIGSSEWVEANRERLERNAVAYINLDMASMGVDFGASASPSLRRLIAEVAREVPQARAPETRVFEAYLKRSPVPGDATRPLIGELGGGSDHVGFLCHAGVPSMALNGGGSAGTSYHTIYDTLAWYRKVVGEDYEPALMIARMTTGAMSRLASDRVLPLDPGAYGPEIKRHLALLSRRAVDAGVVKAEDLDAAGVAARFASIVSAADRLSAAAARFSAEPAPAADAAARRLNSALILSERAWLTPNGLPNRPWFRNAYASPDRDSGYASWTLPALCAAIEDKSEASLAEAEKITLAAIERQIAALDAAAPRTP